MSSYAKVKKGIVTKVIVAEEEFFKDLVETDAGTWVQTSYNTQAGKHTLGGTPLRKNFAGIGYTYDIVRDAFIPPKPFDSWVLDEDTCRWLPPQEKPSDNEYKWNEENQTWDIIE